MHKRNELATLNAEQMFWDILTIVFSFFASFFILQLLPIANKAFWTNSLWIMVVFGMVFILLMLFLRMYNLTTFYYKDRLFFRSAFACLLSMAALFSICFSLNLPLIFLWHSISCGVLSFICILLQRSLLSYFMQKFRKGFNVVFIGDTVVQARYEHFLSQTSMRTQKMNRLDFTDAPLSSVEAFEQFLSSGEPVQEVVFALSSSPTFDFKPFLAVCEEFGITIRVLLNMYEADISQRYLSSIGTFPVVTYHSVSLNRGQILLKRIFDVVVSALGLILCAPLFLIVTIIIRLDSHGPAIYSQPRAGRNGKTFTIYKFRSMRNDADALKASLMHDNKVSDGMMFKVDNDPRITKVGAFLRRTSIDELPQLMNVLKGDMSLVGTRPPTLDEVSKYKPSHWRRISIKPGITGMWQISGRSDVVDFEKVVELDKTYIDNWSIWLDFKLLLKTVAVVLRFRGAQ